MPDPTTNFAAARRMMVDGQLRTYDITDQELLSAMLEVPRERFIPAAQSGIAYLDTDIAVDHGRRMLKPMVLAKLLQAAGITPSDHVLDVGCATGYSSAVLAKLASSVVALEGDSALADIARKTLKDVGATAVTVVTGSLSEGYPAKAPYDVIVLNGVVEIVPPQLLKQLKEGGRLVAVVGSGPATKATLYRRGGAGGEVSARPIFDATGALLPGFSKPAEFVF
jgi:protein-L-isoaspartate(D-aspartate) O-methyltransferase